MCTDTCAVLFRWTRDNCEIVPFTSQSPGVTSRGPHDVVGLNEEVLLQYRTPTSVDDVVQQRTLTVQMNHNNYVHRMHDLLRLEEFTQAKLISESVQLLVSLTDVYID